MVKFTKSFELLSPKCSADTESRYVLDRKRYEMILKNAEKNITISLKLQYVYWMNLVLGRRINTLT